jgi:hypothetical protein
LQKAGREPGPLEEGFGTGKSHKIDIWQREARLPGIVTAAALLNDAIPVKFQFQIGT